ncbi:uncharacterized protein LOC129595474 [Paramacrobiotus metropolitanus]|uniref:uncharacterized protein LOC129595474 n=1 Tax=Paramacrobiotus metropolitanus TaxID=2943436 RepID=UPI00244569B9|nr:uncharacterized protein LOC129595474 [Paramacrobiotus metropolitanus]
MVRLRTSENDEMAFSLGVMPRFQRVWTDVDQLNCQNTVLVRNDDGMWRLGFIQDLDGDQAFIHFGSKTFAPRWMHMGAVWSFPFYVNDGGNNEASGYRNSFVALRDEDNGPFRFRPALITQLLSCCQWMYGMNCIRTNAVTTDAPTQRGHFELVDIGQVVRQLPPTWPSLLERRSDLVCTKHFIPFARAQDLLSDPSDKYRIIMHIHTASGQDDSSSSLPSMSCRFHLRIQKHACMFITIDFSPPRTTAMLAEALAKHMISRAELPPIANRVFRAEESVLCEADDTLVLTASIRDLTPSLLSDIFSHLDVHSQMRTKRVCALWQLLLSSPRMTEHISISLESCWRLKVDNGNCFKAALLLLRSISSSTISLTLLTFPPPFHILFLNNLLEAIMVTRLPLIVFKDHTYNGDPGAYFSHQRKTRLKHTAMIELTAYKHTCNYIILRLLPAHEREFMKRLTSESHELAIDKLQIRIPRLFLKCSDGKMHMASRFMLACNDNFPPVTEEMLRKVTTVHARWVHTLAYPDDWQPIRNFLQL